MFGYLPQKSLLDVGLRERPLMMSDFRVGGSKMIPKYWTLELVIIGHEGGGVSKMIANRRTSFVDVP